MTQYRRSEIRWALVLIILGFGVGQISFADTTADAPSFAGQFANQKLSLSLKQGDNGQYLGEIRFGGQVYPLRASVANGQLSGTFDSSGNAFPFTASFQNSSLVLS